MCPTHKIVKYPRHVRFDKPFGNCELRQFSPLFDPKSVESDGSYELHILSGPGAYTIYPQYWRLDPVEEGFSTGQTVDLRAGDEIRLDLHLRDTFRWVSQSFECPADMIVNLGTIPFGSTLPRILPEDFKTARR